MKKKNGRKWPKTNKPVIKPALKEAVELAGGVTNLALEIGVPQSNVSDWLYTSRQIPAHHVPKIVRATDGKIRPEELRPDVYIIDKKQSD